MKSRREKLRVKKEKLRDKSNPEGVPFGPVCLIGLPLVNE